MLKTILALFILFNTAGDAFSNELQGTCYAFQKMTCVTPEEKSVHFLFQSEFRLEELKITTCEMKKSPLVGDMALWRATRIQGYIKERYANQISKCSMPLVFFENKNQATSQQEVILKKLQSVLEYCNKRKGHICVTEENIELNP